MFSTRTCSIDDFFFQYYFLFFHILMFSPYIFPHITLSNIIDDNRRVEEKYQQQKQETVGKKYKQV